MRAQKTKVTSVLMPGKLAEELDRMVAEEGISKSTLLVRLMARSYQRDRDEEALFRLHWKFGPRHRAAGIKTEEDVDWLVFEDR